MVLQFILPAVFVFAFIMISAYAGALRALEVYFDPEADSIFLSDDAGPPEYRRE
ncbi:hypothetical protein [Halorhabdus amylolytica]|uniref:hypothetical protein n=1 Tax=Halorhabdus amylolytica TaxID=2559573 RepID=UPI00145C1397|nr:hypothetical protein [Halorhabdus amylolytica]